MAVTALSKQVEAQQWRVYSTDTNDLSHDKCIKAEQGTLILSDMEDRNYRRLTLTGAIAAKTLFKRFKSVFQGFDDPSIANTIRVGTSYLGDPLCHFDFSDDDIRSGRKYIEYQIVMDDKGDMYFSLYCRDYKSREGRRYMFSNPDDLYSFAMELGIKKAVIRNGAGKQLNTISVEHLKQTASNLGTMLMIYEAARDPDFKA